MHTHSSIYKYPSHKQPTHLNCHPLQMLLFNSCPTLILKLIKLFMLFIQHFGYTKLPFHSDWECGLYLTNCWECGLSPTNCWECGLFPTNCWECGISPTNCWEYSLSPTNCWECGLSLTNCWECGLSPTNC